MPSTSTCGTTILSRPDSETERLDALPRLPRENGGPVFAEPWQAQAFALAVKLSEQGHFTWSEWAAALGAELKAAAERGEPDDGSHYYEHWLAALERLVTEKGLTDRAARSAQGGLGRCVSAHASRQAGGTRRRFAA
jgi:nitrile hydratase accessory protein